ncbi:hypothetical protein FLA_1042 [Filimonas lacunae]|nr:hypothetical protein FLA_1042 [Filimonas lacunae]
MFTLIIVIKILQYKIEQLTIIKQITWLNDPLKILIDTCTAITFLILLITTVIL